MRLLITLFIFFNLYAKTIDRIEIVVNDIPITSYDIQKTQINLNLPKKQSIDYLIDQAILESLIKKRKIYIDDFDIENAIEKIAKQNGMSTYNFKQYLLSNGKFNTFKQQLMQDLKKEKLLSTIPSKLTKTDVENYYNSHKDEFQTYSKIETIQYSSNNKNLLKEIINNPLINNPNISIKPITFEKNTTNPRLFQFLSKYSTFTPIIKLNQDFVTYYIKSKQEPITIELNKVENQIYMQLLQKEKMQNLQNLIQKEKAKADIQYLYRNKQ